MDRIKPYDKYKFSGIEWLGEVPNQWEIKRLKHIFQIQKRIAGALGYDVLSITQNGIKVKDITSGAGQLSMDYSKYQKIFCGEFGMNHMDLLTGYVDISKYDGVISPDYRIFSLIDSNCDNGYLLRILQLCYKTKIFYAEGQGAAQFGRWRMPSDNFKNFNFPIPSLPEQTAIANFLDYKTAKIDLFIRRKKQLIKLLNEQKAGIINHAVTKGLDANVKMKSSGSEWLGDIPEHWEVRKLKYVINGKLKYGANEPGGDMQLNDPRYIRITDFDKSGSLRKDTFCSLKSELAEPYLLKEGDILFARSGATVGKTFQFKNYTGNACYAGYLIKAEPNTNIILSDYFYRYTCSGIYDKWKGFIFNKATIENIGADKYCNLPVILPSISEQKKIVSQIETETTKLNQAIATIEKEIALVQEYKTALIAEAVTGKIDVREYEIPVVEEEESYEEVEDELSIAAEDEAEYQTVENHD